MDLKLKKLLLLTIVAVIAFGGLFMSKPVEAAKKSQSFDYTVMVIPLDDRPINYDDVIQAGRAANINVIMPPKSSVATKLDDRYGNYSYGNPTSVITWAKNNAYRAQGFIIAHDMLHSGGLVGSRALSPVTTTTIGIENMNDLTKWLKANHGSKPIYTFDTLMRLSSTSGIAGMTNKEYQALRDYGSIERPNSYSTSTAVKNSYPYDKNWNTIPEPSGITATQLSQYLTARERKFDLNRQALDLTRYGFSDYTIIGIDDSSRTSIQDNEIRWIESYINSYVGSSKAIIMDDADGITLTLLSRMANQFYRGGTKVNYFINYFGQTSGNYYGGYEAYTVDTDLRRHIIASGGQVVSSQSSADMEIVFVERGSIYRGAAMTRVENNHATQVPTIVIDDVQQHAGTDSFLHGRLRQGGTSALGSKLMGYSSWNTVGNRQGIAIGMAGARYAFARTSVETTKLDVASDYHASFLFNRFLKDTEYRKNHESRTPRVNYVISYANQFGGNQLNYNDGSLTSTQLANTKAEALRQVNLGSDTLYNEGFGNNQVIRRISQPRTLQYRTVGLMEKFSSSDTVLPWNRTFDVNVDTYLHTN